MLVLLPERPVTTTSLRGLGYPPKDDTVPSFGVSEVFPLFTEDSARALAAHVEAVARRDGTYHTERTPACLRAQPTITAAIRGVARSLEQRASAIAGLPLRLQLPVDHAHVNLQHLQQAAVDDWHTDSTPIVLVTVLTDHRRDPGGRLLVARGDGGKHVSCHLAAPGDAVLMQGSQFLHCAQQSRVAGAPRITVVTSF